MIAFKSKRFILFMVLTTLLTIPIFPGKPAYAAGRIYYVSFSMGDDSNNGTSPSTPWKTFEKANTIVFQPGDQILLKSGDTWTGTTFYPQGNGTANNPIVISSYGTGNRPILSGSEATNVYGIKIVDYSGYKIKNLEFGPIPAGISVWFNNTYDHDFIWVENCYFHDSEIANPAYYDAAAGKMRVPYPDLYTGTGFTIGGVDSVGGKRIISNVTLIDNTFYRTETGVFTTFTSNGSDLNHQYTDLLTNNQMGNFNVINSTFTQNYGGRSLRFSHTTGGGADHVTVDQTGYLKGDSNGVAGIEVIGSSDLLLENVEVKNTLLFGDSINGSGVDISKGNQNIKLSGCNLHDNVGAAFDIYQNNTDIVVDHCTLPNNNVSKYAGNQSYWVGTGNTGVISNSSIYLQNDSQLFDSAVISPMTFASSNKVWNSSGISVFGTGVSPEPASSRLKVGVSKIDITPTANTRTDWGVEAVVPEDILDHIYTRFMVLEDSLTHKRLVFVVPDMALYDELARDPTRIFPTGTLQRFADAAGVPINQVFVIPTHNHQGPETITDETVLQRFVMGIESAISNLTPANMGYIVDRNNLGVNRRPAYGVSPNLAYDNRFVGLKFTRVSDGVPIAAAINYPVHNTGLGNETPANWSKITTELTGIGINYIESQYSSLNSDFIALFLNGFYGDAGPDIYESKNADYNTIVTRGLQFGKEIIPFINNVVPRPLTEPIDAYQATQTVDAIPGNVYDTYDLTFSGAKIGSDIAFIGVDSEPFVEIGANIRTKSPFPITLLSANVNGDSGYVPTYDAYHDGIAGFETILPKGPFHESIEQVVTSNSLNVLNTLYGGGGDGLVRYAATGTAKNSNRYMSALNAFDGNTRTKWVGASGMPTWLQADLGSSKNISRVALNFGNFDKREAGKDYEIQVSDDVNFSTYTTVARDRNNSTGQIAYRFDAVNARYVRFYSTAGYGSDSRVGPAVYEMEVWGSGPAGTASVTLPPDPVFPEDAWMTDDFGSDLSKWVNTTNATINGGRLDLSNNAFMRSSIGNDWTDYSYETDVTITGNGYMGLSFRATDDNNFYMWQFSYGALASMKRVGGNWQMVKPYIALPISLVTDIPHHYKIEVKGSVIKTYIDDILVDTTTDNTFSAGTVGFWTGVADKAAYDNVVVSPIRNPITPPSSFPPGALLTDDFNDGLSKWENTSHATTGNGQLALTDNETMRSAAGSDWTNYSYELDASITSGYMGLSFRAQDDNNYYMWQFSNGTLGFLKKVAGNWQSIKPFIFLPSVAVMTPGTMSHIKIEADGSKITTYVNGVLVDRLEDNTFSSGKVGFRLYSTDAALFDNVVVQEITALAPEVGATGVKINKSSLTLKLGGLTKLLTATIEPLNATNRHVTWSSSDTSVATVTDGVVTPVGAGTATITVTAASGDYTTTCKVKVIKVPNAPKKV
ncbi:discoidin domain-containing protein [Cohnella silvisoli]|uniref:Discoidin domain-containing protein n=1 Tax=Cohnella silvisoli TaxID=2873699 RepID=A0ABV1KQ18_9BACL|nr:discoidin domain-containing protein [Cohnella silvisoli]MCD9025552.1 discoidin domain-containing protein [Cohnella silvisoli]